MMKKIIVILMVCAMMLSLCACSTADHEEREAIGYVIVPHYDGDEHIAITNYWTSNGVIHVDTVDGRHIAACTLIVVKNK